MTTVSGTHGVAALILASVLALPQPAFAQGANTAPATPGPPTRSASAAKRAAWAFIGAGLGFGAGLMFGLNRFDDAINSDRKVWTSALVGAAIGGVAGGVFSGDVKPSFVPKKQPTFEVPVEFSRMRFAQPRAKENERDELWEGMAIGAAVGAVVGLVVVPAKECTPANPECPTALRLGVGIPAIAAGAAVGALVDKLK